VAGLGKVGSWIEILSSISQMVIVLRPDIAKSFRVINLLKKVITCGRNHTQKNISCRSSIRMDERTHTITRREILAGPGPGPAPPFGPTTIGNVSR
jgi:hypothetical protein